MRILFLNPIGALGGGERSLLDLLASLRRARPDLDLHLIACGEGPLLERARSLGARATLLPMPPELASLGDSDSAARTLGSFLRGALPTRTFARRLRDAVRALQPDVLHSNGLKTHLLARFARLNEVPTIWHIRDFVGQRRFAGALLRVAASSQANLQIITVSRAVARDVCATFGEVADRVPIDVIHDGIDTDEFAPAGPRADLDQLAGLDPAPARAVRVGLVATYARWKGHEVFLRAARELIDTRTAAPVRFYIIGGPIYATAASQFGEGELRTIARQLGLRARVGFVPFQPDPAGVYRALDVVVHASTRPEPFGRTIVEAMACGRAVVATAMGGAGEIVTHGVDALAVGRPDVGELSRAMAMLVRDPELRAHLGRMGLETVVARFARERVGEAVLKLYRAMV